MNAERVLEIREGLGWTQERLANELDVHISTVQRWENGKTKPYSRFARQLERIAVEGEAETVFSPQQIRDLRERLGYRSLWGKKNLNAFADLVGVHWRTILHWEEGVSRPSRQSQARLEQLLQEAIDAEPVDSNTMPISG